MLHFRPDLVRKDKIANFVPSSVRMENEFKFLRPTGLHAHAWIAQDIHPSGAAGDASLGTAEKGKATGGVSGRAVHRAAARRGAVRAEPAGVDYACSELRCVISAAP